MEKKPVLKKKMQAVQFSHVDEMLHFLPEDQLSIVSRLRDLVFEMIPDAEERLSYNVPFYRKYKAICFIWPGAIPWGRKTNPGVAFGFNYGSMLLDEAGYLEKGNRKQVFSKRFFSPDEIDEEILKAYILEAWEIDTLLYREKRSSKQK